MTRRLKWIPILLCVLFLALTGVAVVYGRSLPAQPTSGTQLAGLDTCGGKMCLFQIVPGVTSWYTAKQAMSDYITRDEGDHFHGQIGDVAIRVEMDLTGSQISAVEVQGASGYQTPLGLTFQQIIEQYGQPCYVVAVRPRNTGIDVSYPSFTVTVLPDQDRISLSSPVSAITLVDNENLDVDNTSCSHIPGATPWRGFASLNVYRELEQRFP